MEQPTKPIVILNSGLREPTIIFPIKTLSNTCLSNLVFFLHKHIISNR